MLYHRCFIIVVTCFSLAGCPGLPESSSQSVDDAAVGAWRYDPQAPYYDYLPASVQETIDTEPARVAARICREMAGELNIIATASERRDREQRIAFTCRIAEPGMQTSLDFGDLVRVAPATNM